MTLKERVEELEKRVRDLEARPVYVPVYPPTPAPQGPNLWQWQPPQPPYVVTSSGKAWN